MSYARAAGWFDAVNPNIMTDMAFNGLVDGIQAEDELRDEATTLNGVVSGMACSISTTNIAIATGQARVEGKRYSGVGTVAFAGAGAGDYYVYIDPTDDTTPYKKVITTDPGAGFLVLCLVTWNGSDTLSALVDLRVFGLTPWSFSCAKLGAVSAASIGRFVADRDIFIEGVKINAGNTGGTSGATTVDVHKGASAASSTTIFTTQSRRPTLAYTETDNTTAVSGIPDGDRTMAAGEYLDVIVDAIPGTASDDLAVVVYGRYMI